MCNKREDEDTESSLPDPGRQKPRKSDMKEERRMDQSAIFADSCLILEIPDVHPDQPTESYPHEIRLMGSFPSTA
jgi:hypothetical protein